MSLKARTPMDRSTHRLLPALLLALATVLTSVLVPTQQAHADTAITHTQHTALGSGGRHMSSTVTWFRAADGRPDRLVGATQTWNNVKFSGFTGSVIILFKNEAGQTVGFSPIVHPLGVDGKLLGRWSRFDTWQFDVSPDQVAGAVDFEIAHSRGHVNRTEAQVRAAKAWLSLARYVAAFLRR